MQELNGSFVALVSPMKSNGDIDHSALKKLIDWHIEEGTDGIVSVGTTGESATLNFNEHIELIKYTVDYVNNRVPVIAGTGANSTSEALDLTIESEKHNVQNGGSKEVVDNLFLKQFNMVYILFYTCN